MTVDFQVLFPQEVIKLNAIHSVFGATTPTLDIFGQDFSAVDEVLVNDRESPDFQVLSRTRLLAQLPDDLTMPEVTSVNVVSRKLTVTKRSILRFRISDTPSKCTGILKLMQLYVKLLLTTPGSDIFDKKLGGGVLTLLGSSFSKAEGGEIVSKFIVASDSVVRQIIAIQGRQPQLPSDERLLSAKVVSARFSVLQGALLVTVELTSQAGRSATANLVL